MLMLRLLKLIVSPAKGPAPGQRTVTVWFCSPMKSYSARADHPPPNAHSTPTPAVQPKLLVVLLESVWPEPIDRKVRIVCPDPGTAGFTVEQHTVPCITEFAGRGSQPSTIERCRGDGTRSRGPAEGWP